MELIGVNAFTEYNIWRWKPLATVCCMVAPVETAPCKHWFFNEYDGLNSVESERLADKLEKAVEDGSVDQCLRSLQGEQLFAEESAIGALIEKNFGCTVEPSLLMEDWRSVCKADILDFIEFLRACGGFGIC